MNTGAQDREATKETLRQALTAHGGDTKHEAVAAVIRRLVDLNPTATPAHSGALLEGQWLLISAPNFPNGEQRTDGKYTYTLGRLAFNLFQPTKLKVIIDRVWQPVAPMGNDRQRTHDIIVEFTAVDEHFPSLQGTVHNFGVCEPIRDDTLQVQFTGGCLAPADQTSLKTWKVVFGNQSKPLSRNLKQRLLTSISRIMFGLVPPQGMEQETGKVSFKMQRPPKGKLSILYLDEELRITRGNRGTLLVSERQIKS